MITVQSPSIEEARAVLASHIALGFVADADDVTIETADHEPLAAKARACADRSAKAVKRGKPRGRGGR